MLDWITRGLDEEHLRKAQWQGFELTDGDTND